MLTGLFSDEATCSQVCSLRISQLPAAPDEATCSQVSSLLFFKVCYDLLVTDSSVLHVTDLLIFMSQILLFSLSSDLHVTDSSDLHVTDSSLLSHC